MGMYETDSWAQLLRTLSRKIDTITSESGKHSLRVAGWTRSIARTLKMKYTEVEILYWSALLHDIGKIALPRDILEKKGPLTRDEWSYMELHPAIGANLVEATDSMAEVAPIVHAHQEKFDGRGYPFGLQGSDIPVGARILAVVDAYDAMTDNRPYRKAKSHDEAVAELKCNRGQHFDPIVVDTFCWILEMEIKTRPLS